MAATFDINPLGRSAGGQEGSGQAQILKPFDATKFQRAEDAQTAAKQKDNYQKLKDARALKLKELEDLKTPWQEDTNFYSQELEDLRKAMVANEMQFNYNNANIKDPDELYAANSIVLNNQANLNDQAQSLNTEIDYGWQNQEIWADAVSAYKGDNEKYDPITNYRIKEFSTLEGREDLVKEFGVQGARRELLKEYGGSILKDRFNYDKYQTERLTANAKMGKTTTTGWTQKDIDEGLLVRGETTNRIYDMNEILQGELNSLSNYKTYQDWIKDKFRGTLLTAYPKAKNIEEITPEQLLSWAAEAPEFKEYTKQFLPEEVSKYTESATQLRQDGAGSKVLTTDEIQSSTDMSDIQLPTEYNIWNTYTKIKDILKKGNPEIQQSAIYGAHNLTNADVSNPTDAVGVKGKYTLYEDPVTGEKIDVSGSYKILNPGVSGIKKRLVAPVTYKGIDYEVGDYISDDMAKDLQAGKDYQSVSTNTVIGVGQVKDRSKDKTTRSNAEFIATNDYLEDTNFTPETKAREFENERKAVSLDLNNVVVKDVNSNTSYNANDIINSWATEIGGGTITPESYRQATNEYYDAVRNGYLKLQ